MRCWVGFIFVEELQEEAEETERLNIWQIHVYHVKNYYPTNKTLLISFLLSSDAEIFVEHANLRQNVQKRVRNMHIFQRSFHFAPTIWWLGPNI